MDVYVYSAAVILQLDFTMFQVKGHILHIFDLPHVGHMKALIHHLVYKWTEMILSVMVFKGTFLILSHYFWLLYFCYNIVKVKQVKILSFLPFSILFSILYMYIATDILGLFH